MADLDEYVATCNARGFYKGMDQASEVVCIPRPQWDLLIGILGMVTEAAEALDHMKKLLAHGHPFDAENLDKLLLELGDVEWYRGFTYRTLSSVFPDLADQTPNAIEALIQDANIGKLMLRYPQGFSTEASINRKDQ